MSKWALKNKVLTLVLAEVIVFILYASYEYTTYSAREIVFADVDMQVMDTDRSVSPGTYLDTSYESAVAVVSPVFSLDRGIYYIEADYRGNGIMKAGLIYDQIRKGGELVDGNEIVLDLQETTLSYRVKIRESSPIRFKIRLTPEAVDGDYVQLLNVRVVSSDLTYVSSILGGGYC